MVKCSLTCPPLQRCACNCVEERDGDCSLKAPNFCYAPLCPVGTYLCCATCRVATCAFKLNMYKSTRGRHECLKCPPGSYCNGCDLPLPCPEGTANWRYGMSEASHCLPCPGGGYSSTADGAQCCNTDTGQCTIKGG